MRGFCFIVLVAACAATSPVWAEPTLGNMPPSNDAVQTAGINDFRWKAYRFEMGADSLVAGNLILRLRDYDVAGEAIVELRDSNTDIVPGSTVLMTFAAPPPGGASIDDYTFVLQDHFLLEAGTTYWIVVVGVPGPGFDWLASDPGIVPTGLATYLSTSWGFAGTWQASEVLTSFVFERKAIDPLFADGFESPP